MATPGVMELTAPVKGSPDELAHRIQNIAQELQDMILDFVLVVPTGRVDIRTPAEGKTANYRPPVQLQINRATRTKAAEAYYSNVCFYVDDDNPECDIDQDLSWTAYKWLASLTPEHRGIIREIRVDGEMDDFDTVQNPEVRNAVINNLYNMFEYLSAQNRRLGSRRVLKLKVFKEKDDKYESIWVDFEELLAMSSQ